jgi:hypothetical protein
MPRAVCRCGQELSFPVNGPDRVICPRCASRIRVRREGLKSAADPGPGTDDGYIRFTCECGRRLKMRAGAAAAATHTAKCPDCGRLVKIPEVASSSTALPGLKPYSSETPTEELTPSDRLMLDRWAEKHSAARPPKSSPGSKSEPKSRTKPPSGERIRTRRKPEREEVPPEGEYHDQDTISVVGPAVPPQPKPPPTTKAPAAPVPAPATAASSSRVEAGLRVCPRCGRPVHLSAVVCRECGAAVPKR